MAQIFVLECHAFDSAMCTTIGTCSPRNDPNFLPIGSAGWASDSRHGNDFDAGVHRGQFRVATKHHLDVPRVLDLALLGLRDHFADFQLGWIGFRE